MNRFFIAIVVSLMTASVSLFAGCAADAGDGSAPISSEAEQSAKRQGGRSAEPAASDPASTSSTCVVDKATRRSVPPTLSPNASAMVAAWANKGEEGRQAEYQKAASLIGKNCVSAQDCETGSAYVKGICSEPYYGQSQCQIDESSVPSLTCADYVCPTGFECELEANTRAVACVEHRSCPPAAEAPSGKKRR
jgi:hypothetical protein